MVLICAGTLVGCLPNNWLAVSAGSRLGELQSLSDLADTKMLVYSCIVGLIALLPVYLRRGGRQKRNGKS